MRDGARDDGEGAGRGDGRGRIRGSRGRMRGDAWGDMRGYGWGDVRVDIRGDAWGGIRGGRGRIWDDAESPMRGDVWDGARDVDRVVMPPGQWPVPLLIASILSVSPEGLGVHVRVPPGQEREDWLALLRQVMPGGRPLRRCPASIDDERLLGGLDLGASLASGRRVVGAGLLAGCDNGVLLLSMAERAPVELAARLGRALESGELVLERESVTAVLPTRFALIALDDGRDDDPAPPSILLDRLAFVLDPEAVSGADAMAGAQAEGVVVRRAVAGGGGDSVSAVGAAAQGRSLDRIGGAMGGVPEGVLAVVEQARSGLDRVSVPDGVVEALCRTAVLAGIESLRAPLLALRVARIVAALCGHARVEDEDAAVAARLVLAPRARRLPEEVPEPASADPESPTEADDGEADDGEASAEAAGSDSEPPGGTGTEPERDDGSGDSGGGVVPARDDDAQDDAKPGAGTAETVLRAVQAAMAPDVLQPMRNGSSRSRPAAAGSGAGKTEAGRAARRARPSRGRPIGTEPGDPSRGRLDVLATLRAALPWQALRGAALQGAVLPDAALAEHSEPLPVRVRVRREDFRIRRFAPRLQLVTIFLLDASGSSARARLAEAKGCVSILLADCYARRDRVALLAVRHREATLVLPPTGSVVRARRALDQLPGGGGTPLAAGLDAARALAERVRRDGGVPLLVLLTDGRANVARDGSAGRDRAMRDALAAGEHVRALGLPSLLVDISPRARSGAGPEAIALAASLGARCLALPSNNAAVLAREAASLGARQRAGAESRRGP